MAQTCDVDVWLISLEGDTATGEGNTATGVANDEQINLSPDEKLRAARFRFETDRLRWIRSRSALRTILAGCTGVPAPEIRFALGPHGKPALANGHSIEFSLSHAGSWAMVAVTRGVPAGIDIERIRDNVDMASLLRRLKETDLPDSQSGMFRAWCRREAMTKAIGGALLDRPEGDFHICDLEAPAGYSAALALLGYAPQIRRHSTPVLAVVHQVASSGRFCNE